MIDSEFPHRRMSARTRRIAAVSNDAKAFGPSRRPSRPRCLVRHATRRHANSESII